MKQQKYFISILFITILSIIFYYIQNNFLFEQGGKIALAKAIWPGLCIFYWIILPLIIISDRKTSHSIKRCYIIFVLFILLRVVIESIMMYSTKNWHPYYGIIHNILSIILILTILYYLKKHINYTNMLVLNLLVTCTMFLFESYFAYYFLNYIMHGMVNTQGKLFFVPDKIEFLPIIILTWCAITIYILWQYVLVKKWILNDK